MDLFFRLSTLRTLINSLEYEATLDENYFVLPYVAHSPGIELSLEVIDSPGVGDLTYGLYYYLMEFLERFAYQWGEQEWIPTFDVRLESTQAHYMERVKGVFTAA